MGVRSSLKGSAKVAAAEPESVTVSMPASPPAPATPSAAVPIAKDPPAGDVASSERRIRRGAASDRQSRNAISRFLHAQPHWVVWDLPQQSVLRLRAHTYDKHVAKSDEELLNVLRRNYYVGASADWFQQAEGAFADVRCARNDVARVLEDNRIELDLVASGRRPDAVLQGKFDRVTGKEAVRPSATSPFCLRETELVRVVVRSAPGTERGYRIHTAFPTNRDQTRQRDDAIPAPQAFSQLCSRIYQGSHEEYASESEWVASAAGSLQGEQKQVVLAFLDKLLNGQYPDDALERVWCSTSADYGFSPGGHRIFLTKLRDVIRLVLADAFW